MFIYSIKYFSYLTNVKLAHNQAYIRVVYY